MPYRDLKLDSDGDLDLSSGDLEFVEFGEYMLQRLKIRFGIPQGEWPLDVSEGLPWLEEILVRNPDTGRISDLFRARLATTPEVDAITYWSFEFDRSAGSMSLEFAIDTEFGLFRYEAVGDDYAEIFNMLHLTTVQGVS